MRIDFTADQRYSNIQLRLYSFAFRTSEGRAFLRKWFHSNVAVARENGAKGIILDNCTFKASKNFARKLNISEEELDKVKITPIVT